MPQWIGELTIFNIVTETGLTDFSMPDETKTKTKTMRVFFGNWTASQVLEVRRRCSLERRAGSEAR